MGAEVSRELFGSHDRFEQWQGTWRVRTPSRTLEVLRPILGDFGITRVAMLERLDRSPVPVAHAVRPGAKRLSVTQGKGLSDELAKCSAICEAIELHFAENLPRATLRCSVLDRGSEPFLHPDDLARGARFSALTDRMPIDWVEGWGIQSDAGVRRVWIPRALIDLDRQPLAREENGFFSNTGNGLASGNTLAEAVLHGLFEVIERDATAVRGRRLERRDWERSSSAPLIDRLEGMGYQIEVETHASRGGFPVFSFRLSDEDPLRKIPWLEGSGCHLEPEVALSRAVCEAAQARLTYIAGARDDNPPSAYARARKLYEKAPALAASEASHSFTHPSDEFAAEYKNPSALFVEVLRRLGTAGVPEIYFYRHTPAGSPLTVVHVVLPRFRFVH